MLTLGIEPTRANLGFFMRYVIPILILLTSCKVDCTHFEKPKPELLVLPVRVENECKADQIQRSLDACEYELKSLRGDFIYYE